MVWMNILYKTDACCTINAPQWCAWRTGGGRGDKNWPQLIHSVTTMLPAVELIGWFVPASLPLVPLWSWSARLCPLPAPLFRCAQCRLALHVTLAPRDVVCMSQWKQPAALSGRKNSDGGGGRMNETEDCIWWIFVWSCGVRETNYVEINPRGVLGLTLVY